MYSKAMQHEKTGSTENLNRNLETPYNNIIA